MDTKRMLMQNGDTVTLLPKEGAPTAFLIQGVCAESGTAVTYHVLRRSDDGDVSGFLTELYPTDGIRGGEEQFFAKVETLQKTIKDRVNSLVGKNAKISDVEAMKEPFEKTATQKIRRYKYKQASETKDNLEKEEK